MTTRSMDSASHLPLVSAGAAEPPIPEEVMAAVARLGLAEVFPRVVELTRELFGSAFKVSVEEDPEIPNWSDVVLTVHAESGVAEILEKNTLWHRRLPHETCGGTCGFLPVNRGAVAGQARSSSPSRRSWPAGMAPPPSGGPGSAAGITAPSMPRWDCLPTRVCTCLPARRHHRKVRFCLLECGELPATEAGAKSYGVVARQRNLADYDLEHLQCEARQNALVQLRVAQEILGSLETCRSESAWQGVRTRIRAYATEVLRFDPGGLRPGAL